MIFYIISTPSMRIHWHLNFSAILSCNVYFYESNSQKSANLAARTRQSFHLKISQVTLKIHIYFWKFANTFLLLPRTIANLKLMLFWIFYKAPKNWFLTWSRKNNFFSFSKFLALKKSKKTSPLVHG